MKTQERLTNFCVEWINMPPPPNLGKVKHNILRLPYSMSAWVHCCYAPPSALTELKFALNNKLNKTKYIQYSVA